MVEVEFRGSVTVFARQVGYTFVIGRQETARRVSRPGALV
jgi:hypothetical protein